MEKCLNIYMNQRTRRIDKPEINCRIYNNEKHKTSKGPGKRGHIVADALLPTQMFPRLPARAIFVADTNFVFRDILCPQQMFPSLRSPRNIMSNNVATMCPRVPVP